MIYVFIYFILNTQHSTDDANIHAVYYSACTHKLAYLKHRRQVSLLVWQLFLRVPLVHVVHVMSRLHSLEGAYPEICWALSPLLFSACGPAVLPRGSASLLFPVACVSRSVGMAPKTVKSAIHRPAASEVDRARETLRAELDRSPPATRELRSLTGPGGRALREGSR